MKLMIDGVFYNKEIIDFENILKDIVGILGEESRVVSLEFPEVAMIMENTYYHRTGFSLDKELADDETISDENRDEIVDKIKNLFPEGTIVYGLKCEVI
ncbi:hypothetical protein [Methanococcus voltae]|uniref:Uncharacterized protein n=2 Tax=Methanococcus voltae TaxID=2188 RepID=A0A8J7USP7_METVO|nr:hypothetical protein [Methanococcus voltae]MBP2172169.1 hypothetical protein [Methanococcus voltae]MBP2200874.1 hypothetical protein [Methanococcus voltae]MCS3921598.1 hypothetical protein [Methanococcus voltae PS]